MQADEIGAWPGKSFAFGAEHPALWHMLDVAACAQELVKRQSLCLRPEWNGAAVLLIALHDLGKFSNSFRAALREGVSQTRYHWEHSLRLLQDFRTEVEERLGGKSSVRNILVHAVAGHHGGPAPTLTPRDTELQRKQIGPEGQAAARKALEAVFGLPVEASLADMPRDEAVALSWMLSGLTIQADWIGSNPEWFGPAPPGISIPDYWRMAQDRAVIAVQSAGLTGSEVRGGGHRSILAKGQSPRPMQEEALHVPIPDGPSLFLIEDATGAGKTEASLILGARMIEAGKAAGFFFALPTMATSNAMLPRLEAIASAVFKGRPSLALTHSRARQNTLFREIRGRGARAAENQASCGDWLADDRRRVLLADIAVGTIDQALLGVLPTKFSSLRLAALSRRILIVDEAHAYDPYMEAELSRLLEFQARLGGSAVVMTATLPKVMRDRFVTAFQRGLGLPEQAVVPPAYPSLTTVAQDISSAEVRPVEATVRSLSVRRLASEQDALDLLQEASTKGAACVWIRNAVDDAIAAVEALRDHGVQAELLHARFAMGDRLKHEEKQMARFGREGTDRAGAVLVATQVVEQSLDLDFDVMVTDLAPIGALVQRAGRLWRHMDLRPATERPVSKPELHILSPDPKEVKGPRWLHQVLGRGAYVYPLDHQWRTAKAVFDAGKIEAPEKLRTLIEAVHGDNLDPVPSVLEAAEHERKNRAKSESQNARLKMALTDQPFSQAQLEKVWSDEFFPTRLGEPQIVLRLARRKGEVLHPWSDNWSNSEVQLSKRRFESLGEEIIPQETEEIKNVKNRWPAGMREHVVLAEVNHEGVIAPGLRYDVEMGLIVDTPS